MLSLTEILLIDVALGWFDFPMETDIDRQLGAVPSSSPSSDSFPRMRQGWGKTGHPSRDWSIDPDDRLTLQAGLAGVEFLQVLKCLRIGRVSLPFL